MPESGVSDEDDYDGWLAPNEFDRLSDGEREKIVRWDKSSRREEDVKKSLEQEIKEEADELLDDFFFEQTEYYRTLIDYFPIEYRNVKAEVMSRLTNAARNFAEFLKVDLTPIKEEGRKWRERAEVDERNIEFCLVMSAMHYDFAEYMESVINEE